MNTFKILRNLCSSLVVPAVLTVLWIVVPMGCSRSTPPSMKCDPNVLYAIIAVAVIAIAAVVVKKVRANA